MIQPIAWNGFDDRKCLARGSRGDKSGASPLHTFAFLPRTAWAARAREEESVGAACVSVVANSQGKGVPHSPRLFYRHPSQPLFSAPPCCSQGRGLRVWAPPAAAAAVAAGHKTKNNAWCGVLLVDTERHAATRRTPKTPLLCSASPSRLEPQQPLQRVVRRELHRRAGERPQRVEAPPLGHGAGGGGGES